ncbi:MAG TPA: hypothetical protein VFP31_09565 [Gaiellaceae bacterium]|nr:hypothetical protein [Gaiellaceae bacterium]
MSPEIGGRTAPRLKALDSVRRRILRSARNREAGSFVVRMTDESDRKGNVSLLWIILIVVLVLVLLGFFGRGRY